MSIIATPEKKEKNVIKKAILFILGYMALVPAVAEEKRIVSGAGVNTCEIFISEHSKDPNLTSATYFSWAQGFMAAHNLTTYSADKSYRSLDGDIEAQYGFLVEFCSSRPQNTFASAVIALFRSFPKKT